MANITDRTPVESARVMSPREQERRARYATELSALLSGPPGALARWTVLDHELLLFLETLEALDPTDPPQPDRQPALRILFKEPVASGLQWVFVLQRRRPR